MRAADAQAAARTGGIGQTPHPVVAAAKAALRPDIAVLARPAARTGGIGQAHRAVVGATTTLLGALFARKALRAIGQREAAGARRILGQPVAGDIGTAGGAGGPGIALIATRAGALGVGGAHPADAGAAQTHLLHIGVVVAGQLGIEVGAAAVTVDDPGAVGAAGDAHRGQARHNRRAQLQRAGRDGQRPLAVAVLGADRQVERAQLAGTAAAAGAAVGAVGQIARAGAGFAVVVAADARVALHVGG